MSDASVHSFLSLYRRDLIAEDESLTQLQSLKNTIPWSVDVSPESVALTHSGKRTRGMVHRYLSHFWRLINHRLGRGHDGQGISSATQTFRRVALSLENIHDISSSTSQGTVAGTDMRIRSHLHADAHVATLSSPPLDEDEYRGELSSTIDSVPVIIKVTKLGTNGKALRDAVNDPHNEAIVEATAALLLDELYNLRITPHIAVTFASFPVRGDIVVSGEPSDRHGTTAQPSVVAEALVQERLDTVLHKVIYGKGDYVAPFTVDSFHSLISQLVLCLGALQSTCNFVHGDAHASNWGVLFTKARDSITYFDAHCTEYEVPTHGRFVKLFDYGRSRFEVAGHRIESDWVNYLKSKKNKFAALACLDTFHVVRFLVKANRSAGGCGIRRSGDATKNKSWYVLVSALTIAIDLETGDAIRLLPLFDAPEFNYSSACAALDQVYHFVKSGRYVLPLCTPAWLLTPAGEGGGGLLDPYVRKSRRRISGGVRFPVLGRSAVYDFDDDLTAREFISRKCRTVRPLSQDALHVLQIAEHPFM